jgi:hypothetical protein
VGLLRHVLRFLYTGSTVALPLHDPEAVMALIVLADRCVGVFWWVGVWVGGWVRACV